MKRLFPFKICYQAHAVTHIARPTNLHVTHAFLPDRWDEIGYFDIPACIDYVLAKTGWDKLVYTGHSLGTGLFFIAAIQHPQLNAKVHRMIALAPISSKHSLKSPFRLVAPLIQPAAVSEPELTTENQIKNLFAV